MVVCLVCLVMYLQGLDNGKYLVSKHSQGTQQYECLCVGRNSSLPLQNVSTPSYASYSSLSIRISWILLTSVSHPLIWMATASWQATTFSYDVKPLLDVRKLSQINFHMLPYKDICLCNHSCIQSRWYNFYLWILPYFGAISQFLLVRDSSPHWY